VYSKNLETSSFSSVKTIPTLDSNPDNDPRGNWFNANFSSPAENPNAKNVYTLNIKGNKYTRRWWFDRNIVEQLIKDNRVYVPANGGVPRLKKFRSDFEKERGNFENWIEYSTSEAQEDLDKLLGGNYFNYPKNVDMIKHLIQSQLLQPNATILDFFAGSGTTAHAVMKLNAEDGGNRRFILCTLDEECKAKSEAKNAGYITIDEISRERIKRAGQKIKAEYEEKETRTLNQIELDIDNNTPKWNKDIGFKHYRFITPDVATLDKIIEFNPSQIKAIPEDMVNPFSEKSLLSGVEHFAHIKNKAGENGVETVLQTWLIDDGYDFDTKVSVLELGVGSNKYKAHHVEEHQRLYLIDNTNWNSEALKDLLNRLGKNEINVNAVVIYNYSFTFNALTEIKNNFKANLDKYIPIIERF
jgi:adenine-specific DNA-methyltransferase